MQRTSAIVWAVAIGLTAPWQHASAQGFSPKTDFGTGTAPRSVAVGDLNGDGKPDLATANTTANTVSILLGTGGGAFGAKTDLGTATGPYGIAVGDINRDGKLDLAVACNSGSAVSVLLGDGTGGFPTRNDFATGTNARTVAIADLSGDGKPDLVTANSGGNNVSVLLGDGTGTAGGFTRTDYATALFPFAIAVGDLNLDGRPDLVATNENSASVSVLLGTGGGAFGSKTDFTTGGTPHSVAVGDLDRDGKSDLAVANQASNTLSVLLGFGTGVFGTKTDFATGTSPYSLSLGDVDGDGKLDVVTSNQGASTVSALLGDGFGGLGSKSDFATGTQPQWVEIRDLSGDGRPDLAVTNTTSNTVSVLLNAYPFPAAPLVFGRYNLGSGDGPERVAIADLNHDFWPDLAVTNGLSNTVSVTLNDGVGDFDPRTDFATGAGPVGIAVAELSGDGHADLVTVNATANTVSVLLGTGSGGFGAKTDFATGTSPVEVACADFSRDGVLDLAVVNLDANTVTVLLGSGGGVFGSRLDYTTGVSPNGIAIGDLDGDGKVDLAVTNSGASTLSIFRGLGNGTFIAKTDFAAGGGPRSPVIADFNADGKADVALLNFGGSTASFLAGIGNATFPSRSTFPTGANPRALAAGDLNGDGKADLATVNYGGTGFATNTVSVLLGDGAGSFGPKSDFPTENGPFGIAIGDIDGDGRPDLAVPNFAASSVSVPLNGRLTIVASAGSGGTIVPHGAVPVPYGTNRAFTITGSTCHPIDDVLVDGATVGTSPNYTFTNVTSDHSIAASFDSVVYSVSASAGPGGTVSPSGTQNVPCGANQTFTFMPNACKVVTDVLLDGVPIGPRTSYAFQPIDANHTLEVHFGSVATCAIFPPSPGQITCASPGNELCTMEFEARMSGGDEVPSTSSTAVGLGRFAVDGANHLHYEIQFFGLSSTETVAHIHGLAAPGANAPVIASLPLGSSISGEVALTPAQVSGLRNGLVYVNVHSSNFPAGEIRGQLLPRFASYTWTVGALDPGWAITGGQGTSCITYSSGASGSASFKLVATTPSGCSDSSAVSVGCGDLTGVPQVPMLGTAIRATPNPMCGRGRIDFTLAVAGMARVEVFSLSGQRVRTLAAGPHPAGPSSVTWDGRSEHGARLAPGAYLLRLTTESRALTEKILLLR